MTRPTTGIGTALVALVGGLAALVFATRSSGAPETGRGPARASSPRWATPGAAVRLKLTPALKRFGVTGEDGVTLRARAGAAGVIAADADGSLFRERARKHPKTFEVPRMDAILALRPGDVVKLIWESRDGMSGERMWVEIRAVLADGRFVGTLRSDPAVVPMRFGDEVAFHAVNVCAIEQT